MRRAHLNLLDPDQVAARLRIAPAALERLWREDQGPRRTFVAGNVLVAEAALAEWIDANSEQKEPVHVRAL